MAYASGCYELDVSERETRKRLLGASVVLPGVLTIFDYFIIIELISDFVSNCGNVVRYIN